LARYQANNAPTVVTLPAAGGIEIAFVVDGKLHVRRSRTSPDLIAPVALEHVSVVQFQGSKRSDRLTLDASLNVFAGTVAFFGNAGDDSLDARTMMRGIIFSGGVGNDTFTGGSGNDIIDGGDGNDFLQGSDGNDSIRGGNGNDILFGGKGNDLLMGSAGNDLLFGDAGTDTLLGESGNDVLMGGADTDTINPGSGRNIIADSSRVIDATFSFDFDALLAAV
jgi:hypothetical protein